MSSRSGVAVIALSALFFALLAVLARTLTVSDAVPSAQLVVIRHLVGIAAMVALFAARRRRPLFARPGLLLLRGLFGGGAVVTFFYAIQTLGPAAATVLNYVAPVYAAVWAALFLGERAPKTLLLGLGVATVGAVLVTVSTAQAQPTASLLGAAAGIASGLFGGAAMATVKAVREDADAPTVFLVFCVVGLVLGLPFAAPQWVPLSSAQLSVALLIGALAVGGQLLFTWGMGYTSATAGSTTTQLVPVFTWALALGWLGERVQPLAVVGAVCCVGGVLLGAVRLARSDRST